MKQGFNVVSQNCREDLNAVLGVPEGGCVGNEISQTDGEMHSKRGCRTHCGTGYDWGCSDMTACWAISWNDMYRCLGVIFLSWDFCHLCYLFVGCCGQVSETFCFYNGLWSGCSCHSCSRSVP